MAWMRMMGAESVAYHRRTVLERGDDYPGMALAYYTSRGETPLRWGGSGAEALGLDGPVSPEGYEAIFGPGGARHPESGAQLVAARRPGMELVISAHKSVAELGGDRPGRAHASDHGRRARRHPRLPRPGDPQRGRATRSDGHRDRDRRAGLRAYSPRHFTGRGSMSA